MCDIFNRICGKNNVCRIYQRDPALLYYFNILKKFMSQQTHVRKLEILHEVHVSTCLIIPAWCLKNNIILSLAFLLHVGLVYTLSLIKIKGCMGKSPWLIFLLRFGILFIVFGIKTIIL